MQTVSVNASKQYDILIGEGVLEQLVYHPAALKAGERCAIFTDENVAQTQLSKLVCILQAHDVPFETFVLPGGERSKRIAHLEEMLEFLSEKQFSRADKIIAFGGGVVGDITALCAALYLRGVTLIQIPTTLLACVDSSVGGKCAVDLSESKNSVGTFYQPALVLCDPTLLSTLPTEEFANGMAEVIKYAIGWDKTLFKLCEEAPKKHLNEIITRCIRIKRDVVESDEFDLGERQKLNLGHTPAHAIEALSQFAIPHGAAVGMGLSLMAHAYLTADAARIDTVLNQNGLSTTINFDAKALADASLSDKKRRGNTLSLIVPTAIGACEIRPTATEDLEEIYRRALS